MIKEVENYIKDLEDLELKKKQAMKKMFDNINKLEEENRRKAICEIYLLTETKEKDIKDAFNIKTRLSFYCGLGIEETTKCKACGEDFIYHIRNKSEYKEYLRGKDIALKYDPVFRNKNNYTIIYSKFVCDKCKDEAEKRIQENIDLENNKFQEEKRIRMEEIKKLATMPYKEYLQTEHWRKTRLEVIRQAKNRCQICNANSKILHVHHRNYANRGNEKKGDLICLCADCHAKFHDKETQEDKNDIQNIKEEIKELKELLKNNK